MIREAWVSMVLLAAVVAAGGAAGCSADGSSARKVPPSSYVPVTDAAREDRLAAYASVNSMAVKPAAPPAPTGSPPALSVAPDAAAQRVVIYSGSVQLVVPNSESALNQVAAFAAAAGGYLDERTAVSITVRVPAGAFEAVVARVTALGEVVRREVKAQDITEEMLDLRIRLDNAERTRQRLLELLKKSNKVEDTLKIEVELGRVTETIEQIKGRQRFLELQAAMSTLSVHVNAPASAESAAARVPFAWVRELGDGLVTGRAEPSPRSGSWLDRGVRVDLPAGFVRYFVTDTRTEAMDAGGLLVKLRRHDNFDRGDLAFWQELARRALTEQRGITLTHTRAITTKGGAPAVAFTGTRTVSGKPQGYLLILTVGPAEIQTLEAWGEEEAFTKSLPALTTAGESLRLRK